MQGRNGEEIAVILLKMSMERKLWAHKRGGQDQYILLLSTVSDCKTNNWCIASQVYFKHHKNSRFVGRTSLLFARFGWKFVTWFFTGSCSSPWHHLADLGDNHLATLPVSMLLKDDQITVMNIRPKYSVLSWAEICRKYPLKQVGFEQSIQVKSQTSSRRRIAWWKTSLLPILR